jgi:hypothetical protein
MDQWYFRPVNFPRKRSREDVVTRLQTSYISRWVSLVGMSIVEASRAGDSSQHSFHNTWIGHIEGCLQRELLRDLTPRKTQQRHNDWIHVSSWPCLPFEERLSEYAGGSYENYDSSYFEHLSNVAKNDAHIPTVGILRT